MADLADFRIEYPDFDALADAVIEYYLDKADVIYRREACPQFEPYMHIALTAHLIVKSQHNPDGEIDDSPSPALQKKVKDVSVSYGYIRSERDFSTTDAWYGSTPYGKEYLIYRVKCFGSGATVAP